MSLEEDDVSSKQFWELDCDIDWDLLRSSLGKVFEDKWSANLIDINVMWETWKSKVNSVA